MISWMVNVSVRFQTFQPTMNTFPLNVKQNFENIAFKHRASHQCIDDIECELLHRFSFKISIERCCVVESEECESENT